MPQQDEPWIVDGVDYYATRPVPRMPLRKRTCRLCYRREDTHSNIIYEIVPGKFMCIYDLALAAEFFREIVPDGEEAYRLVRP